MLGATVVSDPESTAIAVSSTLFGSPGSRDDEGSKGFFAGTASTDYYDPRNSFIDCVLARRRGIPITLSLIFMEVCEQLDLPMVGLNAPGHLLLAPADTSLRFVVDPFFGGRVMSEDQASVAIAQNAGSVAQNPSGGVDPVGAAILDRLRAQPMDAHTWCARMLRNLRGIYTASNDVVGIIGTNERLRLIGAARPGATSPEEQAACAAQLASAIIALQWEARRPEARTLLEGVLDDEEAPDGLELTPEGKRQIEGLLGHAWLSHE